jgi:hypothetical protein
LGCRHDAEGWKGEQLSAEPQPVLTLPPRDSKRSIRMVSVGWFANWTQVKTV